MSDAKLLPVRIQGKGWGVVLRVGSRKKGFNDTLVSTDTYTLAQAQSFVSNNRASTFIPKNNPSKRKMTAERRAQLIAQLKKARAARGAAHGTKSRKKSAKKVSKKRRKNPIRHVPLYAIIAQKGNGPKMHFNGVKFTNNGKPALFENEGQMMTIAKDMIKKFPILRDYKLTGVPIKGTVSGKA